MKLIFYISYVLGGNASALKVVSEGEEKKIKSQFLAPSEFVN
jgi:hypothetical protein